ncbi:MAG TPA: hypothetical protein VNC22_15800 [Sporichthya sp.]|nr:hypothetical protein [Sporichthya sp.]
MARKTWVWLQGRKRPPGEYEELSTGVQWYGDPVSRTDVGSWRLDSTVIKADWDAFRDPNSMYYRNYIVGQDSAERSLDAVFAVAKEADFISGVHGTWRDDLLTLLGAMSHAEWGIAMAHQHVQRFSLSPTIACCSQLQVMDKLRAAERNLEWFDLLYPDGENLTSGVWMDEPSIQPLRKLLEEILIVQDWSEVVVATNVALLGMLLPFQHEVYVKGGRAHGDFVTAALGAAYAKDGARHTSWGDAFVKLTQTEESNATVVSDWLDRYVPAAVAAVESLAAGFPVGGIATEAVEVAKSELRARLEALNVKRTDSVVAALEGNDRSAA